MSADAVCWSAASAPANDVSPSVSDAQRVLGAVVARLATTLGPDVRVVTESRRTAPLRCDEETLACWLVAVATDLATQLAGGPRGSAELLFAIEPDRDRVRLRLEAKPLSRSVIGSTGPTLRALPAPRGVALTTRFHGAAFEVELSVAVARGVHDLGAELPVAAGRPRVAVIDDDSVVGRSIQRILGQQYAVEVFSDAREALRRVAAGADYALLLCDLMMPAMTGMAFCAALEAEHPEVVRRCVWMTGGAFTEEAVEFVTARRAACVEKPFEARALRSLAAARCGGH